jgi:hypothetical protein
MMILHATAVFMVQARSKLTQRHMCATVCTYWKAECESYDHGCCIVQASVRACLCSHDHAAVQRSCKNAGCSGSTGPQVHADNPELWHKAHNLEGLSLDDWDDLFQPGMNDDNEVAGREYVLNPVDGAARYVHRSSELVESQATPHQDVEMTWPAFAMSLSHAQALNVTLLLQEVSRHQARTALPLSLLFRCPLCSRLLLFRSCMVSRSCRSSLLTLAHPC